MTRGRTRRYAGNVAWLVIGDGIAKVSSFVFVVAVARGLPQTDYGYFNFAISFIPLFLVFAVWGLDDTLLRDLARSRERISELVSTTLLLRTLLALLAVVVSISVAPALVDSGRALMAFALVAMALLFDELGKVLGVVFKALERARFRAMRILINRLVTTLLALGALWLGGDLIVVCWMYALGSLVALLYAWYSLSVHFAPVRFSDANRDLGRSLLGNNVPLAVAGVMSMAVFRIDAVMLQAIEGPLAVAMYGVAYRFLDSLLFVSWAVAGSVVPRLARASEPSRQARALEGVMSLCLAVYLPLAVGSWFAGEWAVRMVFGERYAPAGAAVVWLLPATAVYGSAYVARMGCLAIQARRQIALSAVLALAVNLAGNLFAIPRYGIAGAAAVTLFTGIVELLFLTTVFWRLTTVKAMDALPVPVLASAVLASVLFLNDARDLTAVLIGVPVYLVALMGFLLMMPSGRRRWWSDALSPDRAPA